MGNVDFEKKVIGTTENCTKLQLLNITIFFFIIIIDPKDDEAQLVSDAISAVCNLKTFRDTFETSSDLDKIQENTDNPNL